MSGWLHILCDACWERREPGGEPTRAKGAVAQPCCGCGAQTESGIFVREEPTKMWCGRVAHVERPS